MAVIIFQILLVVSLGAVVFILARKIPVLVDLKEEEEKPSSFKVKQVVFETIRRVPPALKEKGAFTVKLVSSKLHKKKEEKPIKFDEEHDYWEKVGK